MANAQSVHNKLQFGLRAGTYPVPLSERNQCSPCGHSKLRLGNAHSFACLECMLITCREALLRASPRKAPTLASSEPFYQEPHCPLLFHPTVG